MIAVSLDCIERAIRVTEWLKQESQRIYNILGESDAARHRRELVEWIARRGGTVTVRELTHGMWSFRGDAPGARAALDGLVQLGIGRWVSSSPGPGGGRPAERFELTNLPDLTITETPCSGAASGGFGDGDGGDGAGGEDTSGNGFDHPDAPAGPPDP